MPEAIRVENGHEFISKAFYYDKLFTSNSTSTLKLLFEWNRWNDTQNFKISQGPPIVRWSYLKKRKFENQIKFYKQP